MRKVRIYLLMITFSLICIGIVMIYSASSIYAWEVYKDSAFFLKRHLVFVCIGLIITLFIMALDYNRLRAYSKPLLIFSFLLLLLVLIPGLGKEVGGARRWFRWGGIGFQPSELVYIALILYLADFLSRKGHLIGNFFSGILPPILVLGLVTILILMQPDLGSAIALSLIVLIILFVAGMRFSHLGLLFVLSLPILYVLIFSVPYRRTRIMTFLNPWHDPKGAGFQIIQSQIALGRGGLFGQGLGKSMQKLFYLPAAHTDFIFSIIGEELGLIGTLAIVILFGLLLFYGAKIVKNAADKFGFYLSLGILLMIGLKVIINFGVSTGIFPTKGIPLPFISYGGSSLIFDMLAVGLLFNISRYSDYI